MNTFCTMHSFNHCCSVVIPSQGNLGGIGPRGDVGLPGADVSMFRNNYVYGKQITFSPLTHSY